jgi:uncharacterized protein (UPF0335 family)
MSDIGHNNPPVATSALTSLIERLERLDEEKAAVLDDIKAVYSEAKSSGFDTKALRRLIALRRKDKAKLLEEKAMLELYASALGCLDLV